MRRPTAGALLGRAASAICDSRPRAVDDSARRRLLACGVGSGRAWPRRILVIGGRRKRIARFQFSEIESRKFRSRPQKCFRQAASVVLFPRSGIRPRHVWPSLMPVSRITDVRSHPHFPTRRQFKQAGMRRMFQGGVASADGNDARHWVLSAASLAALRALCSSRVISSPRATSAKASSTYGGALAGPVRLASPSPASTSDRSNHARTNDAGFPPRGQTPRLGRCGARRRVCRWSTA